MFLDTLHHQIEVFAAVAGVSSGDVVIRVVLADGDYRVATGSVRVVPPFGGTAWGMIITTVQGRELAVLIRESDVFKIQLEVAAMNEAIGYAAERDQRRQP